MKARTTKYFIKFFTLALLLLAYSSLSAQYPLLSPIIYGLSNNQLFFFRPERPEQVTVINTIKGIAAGQKLVGMDFRPNTGELFALGYNSSNRQARLYQIDVITTIATPIGTSVIKLDLGDGSGIGFDFNPTVDRIRVVTSSGTNVRLNPVTGGIAAEDGILKFSSSDRNAGRTPRVMAGAYTNSYIGSTTTTLYDIEAASGNLVIQNPPNDGVLNTVGSLGITFSNNTIADLDLAYNPAYINLVYSNPAYLVASTAAGNRSLLHQVNLVTGRAIKLDTIGFNGVVENIAVRIDRSFSRTVNGSLVYAVTTNNNLISFDSKNPSVIRSLVAISGIAAGQTLVGTDFRPNTGELFGLGYNNANGEAKLYTINLQSGIATAVGTANLTLDLGAGPVGFDFNPTVDRIRVESANRKNYRLNPITGGIAATDSDLKFAATDANAAQTPFIGSIAYTNSFVGATTTTLYAYDDKLNILATQNPPNDGVLNTVGKANVTVNPADLTSDLDIAFDPNTGTNTAFFVANDNNWDVSNDSLYTINLQTGAVTTVDRIGLGIPIRDIAVFVQGGVGLPLQGQLVYAVTNTDRLISFDTQSPDVVRSLVTITGIATGQTLVGTDFRPNTGELFGLGYNSTNREARLYTINLQTGLATAVGTTNLILDLGTAPIGFDFNPTVDRIRIVGANRKNFRLNPVNGSIAATDGDLKFATADVNAVQTPAIGTLAYTNSFIGSTATTLYVYDDKLNTLAIQNPPNDGVLNTVGTSGITVNTSDVTSDLDIVFNANAGTNTAYLAANTSGTSDNLYLLNLQTGRTTDLGRIAGGLPIRDIAIFIDRTIPATVEGQLAFGWTANNILITFDTKKPEIIRTSKAITGIPAGQLLVGMDFRPATGELWAMSYNRNTGESILFTVDTTTAALVQKTTTPFVLDLGLNASALIFDFNPTVDRIRVMGENGRNYRLNPVTATIAATDGNLNYASGDKNAFSTPRIGSGAYTNSFNTATTTTLYDYDVNLNAFSVQNPPNNGTLNTVGTSGIMVSQMDPTTDLDIFYDFRTQTNIAYFVANTGSSRLDSLYTVNLQTGALTLLGRVGSGIALANISIRLDSVVSAAPRRIAILNTTTAGTFTAMPNPGRDEIRIQLNETIQEGAFTVQLADINGQILRKQVATADSDTTLRWDASDLNPGMYLISVMHADGKVETLKWLKQ